jgi:cytochrome c-type biogenesis protein CcmF
MLLDPWMFIHPPFHLAGYIVFTVPFAFAIAALLTKRLGDEWIIATRRWTLIAWLFLGIGLFTGGWWAYVVLGWGGYWAWDPVENAGLMPWLVATAYLHSVMMQRRRNILKVWNLALIILTFSLTIFGTFLVRSGIIPSVHAFAQAPVLGSAFLTFIGGVFFGSLGLLYYRYKELKSEGEIESLVSRESTFLLNNLLLVGATFAVFIGTIFPVITEAVRGIRIVVGPPFFNQVVVPIFVAIIFLTGVCTLISWRRASVKNLIRNFLWPLLGALILGIGLFVLGIKEWHALVAFSICGFVLFTIFSEWFRGTRARHQKTGDNYLKSFLGLIRANRPRHGGYIAHIAIILIAIGVVGSVFDVDKGATLMPGESMTIKHYTLTYETKDMYETPSKLVVSTTLSVYNQGRFVGTVIPERHFYRNPEQPVSEVAVRSTLRHDLYVVLVSWDKYGATAFEVSINPLVSWIWIGGGVLVLGGLICLWPDRQKLPNRDKPRLRRK